MNESWGPFIVSNNAEFFTNLYKIARVKFFQCDMKVHVNITSTRDFSFIPPLWSFKMKTKPSKETKNKNEWAKL